MLDDVSKVMSQDDLVEGLRVDAAVFDGEACRDRGEIGGVEVG
jgi:hypothetical protein